MLRSWSKLQQTLRTYRGYLRIFEMALTAWCSGKTKWREMNPFSKNKPVILNPDISHGESPPCLSESIAVTQMLPSPFQATNSQNRPEQAWFADLSPRNFGRRKPQGNLPGSTHKPFCPQNGYKPSTSPEPSKKPKKQPYRNTSLQKGEGGVVIRIMRPRTVSRAPAAAPIFS